MNYPNEHLIFTNFDTSIILPFYKKLKDFKRILPLNTSFFERNGIEVIIVMDEPSEQKGLIDFIKNYPFINWIVLVNNTPHSWRNPCKAINVGLKASTKKYIMVCSPESQFYTDAIFRLRYIAECYGRCFTIGKVVFSHFGSIGSGNFFRPLPYGSTLVKKEYLLEIGGYSEFFDKWGGEDDNLRAKLEYVNIKKVYVDDAILVHYEDDQNGFDQRSIKSREIPLEVIRRSYYPEKQDFDNPNWGNDFSDIIYHYRDNIYAEELCNSYLAGFKKIEIIDKAIYTKQFKTIALIQTHNEEHHITDVLKHLDTICDGIILLDDESTDGTFDLASSEKLLLKVQKQKVGFNDLLNRNILLNISSFIKSGWQFFIDADERLMLWDKRLEDLCSEEAEGYCFYLVHLWNSENCYRLDLPESSPIGIPGVLHRWRLFKNLGRAQIVSHNALHFQSIPYSQPEKQILPVLIIHYGMISSQIRKRKYDNYLKEDDLRNHYKYQYFLDEEVQLGSLTELDKLPGKQFKYLNKL